jgi:hypothetical protein
MSLVITNEQACELLELYREGDTTEDWDCGEYPLKFKLMESELIDTTRWSAIYSVVYQDLTTGKYYQSSYSTGATECQEERPYEYDGAEIELTEVVPVEKTVIEYVVKKNSSKSE